MTKAAPTLSDVLGWKPEAALAELVRNPRRYVAQARGAAEGERTKLSSILEELWPEDSLANHINLDAHEMSTQVYVLFELGASWGLRKPTFPLRIAGATFKHVPEVLRERSSLTLEDVTQCLQLVEDVGRISSLSRKAESPEVIGAVHRQAEMLAEAAKAPIARM